LEIPPLNSYNPSLGGTHLIVSQETIPSEILVTIFKLLNYDTPKCGNTFELQQLVKQNAKTTQKLP